MRKKLKFGQRCRISEGAGIDSRKVVTIVSPRNIKVDGHGIPTNVPGAYKRPDWKREYAIQFEDGSYGLMFDNYLEALT